MGAQQVRSLLEGAGFSPVDISVTTLQVSWPDAGSAAAGVLGTPFGPLVNALSPDQRARFDAALAKRFAPERPGTPVYRETAAVIARAVAA